MTETGRASRAWPGGAQARLTCLSPPWPCWVRTSRKYFSPASSWISALIWDVNRSHRFESVERVPWAVPYSGPMAAMRLLAYLVASSPSQSSPPFLELIQKRYFPETGRGDVAAEARALVIAQVGVAGSGEEVAFSRCLEKRIGLNQIGDVVFIYFCPFLGSEVAGE